jgi:cysteine-rich repeat protein
MRVNKDLPSCQRAFLLFFAFLFLFQFVSSFVMAEESLSTDRHKNEKGFGHEEGRPGMRVGHQEDGKSAPSSPSPPILPEPDFVMPGATANDRKTGECGNDEIEFQEACDDGNTRNGDGCSANCELESDPITCGNNEMESGEECDDGNIKDGDGCSSECKTEIICGDGAVGLGEECDDGNVTPGDGCGADCKSEASPSFCGNGVIEGSEQCDEGPNNGIAGGTCSVMCETVTAVCGDGKQDPGEQCDGGSDCTSTCQFADVCGNGLREGAEQCDDGNTRNDDGCSETCMTELVTSAAWCSRNRGRRR